MDPEFGKKMPLHGRSQPGLAKQAPRLNTRDIRNIRGTFERVYGAGKTAEVLGLASDIPEDPVVLNRYAGRVLSVMEDTP